MQYINLNKILGFENNIQDLLLISIDEQIDTINDKDGIRMSGIIAVSGEVKTTKNEKFEEKIDLDIFLTEEEILDREGLNVSVNDFNYNVDGNKLILDISLKVVGLKEIEVTFPSKEDSEDFSTEDIEKTIEEMEDSIVYIDENIDVKESKEIENDAILDNLIEDNDVIEDRIINNEEFIESNDAESKKNIVRDDENVKESKIVKKSLIKSVFSNRMIREEVSWKLHCVKGESSYEEVANKYNVNLDRLISINNNEPIEEGKLIFLPLD